MTTTTAFALADPELSARLTERLGTVEARLREAVATTDLLVGATSTHLVSAGGKRLRPLLALLTAELGDPDRSQVIDGAVVVELTHLASLYHDDVMDDAPLRRGAPAAHEVWGNSIAILTGDLLFARASQVVAHLGQPALTLQADTFVRLCMGQMHETVGPATGEDPVEHYLQVLADKTASLIATSAQFGAMLSGCSPEVVATVGRFGELIGLAFQLADDVLDLTSDGSLSGKTPGTDLRDGVPTMPVLLLRARAAGPDATDEDRAAVALLDSDLSDDDRLAAAVATLGRHPVVEETRQRAVAVARAAVAELAPLPDGPVKESLVQFADALVDRAA
ncbi:polyprenyl synthetase family protein [Cellulomonas sp. NTE-D12]|uniref:polyprenyl synthetase family protein n=1 Tax=Cellulomonas sp. NTE-D12 TaxID=2962632 RepID=UPI0030813835|nr:geranylgeranyl pyrophosphate synthase [Cellulomonas sp. NTE-D12]